MKNVNNTIDLDKLKKWIKSVKNAEKNIKEDKMESFWADYNKMNQYFREFSKVILSEKIINSIPEDLKDELRNTYAIISHLQTILSKRRDFIKKKIKGKGSMRKISYAYNPPGKTRGRNLKLYAGVDKNGR